MVKPPFSSPRSSPWLSWVPLVLYAVVSVYFLSASSHSLFDFPLDDAWIHRVYAQSFAYGHGFAYNFGGPQEAGSTSPLWTLATVPAHWLEGLSPEGIQTDVAVVTVKLIGMLLGGLILRSVMRLAMSLTQSQIVTVLAGCLLAVDPRLLFSAFSGMETLLLVALWLWATEAYLKGRWGWSVLLFSLTPTARPEALLILPFWLVGLLFLDSHDRPPIIRVFQAALLGIPMGLWSLFCLHANGHLLPTTFYIKSQPFTLDPSRFQELWNILIGYGYTSVPIFVLGLVAYVGIACRRFDFPAKASGIFLLIVPLVYMLGTSGSRTLSSLGYYWHRWIDPASLVLTAAFCIGYAALLNGLWVGFKRLRDRSSHFSDSPTFGLWKNSQRSGLWKTWESHLHSTLPLVWIVLGVIGIAGLVGSAPSFSESWENRRQQLASDGKAIHQINVRTGKWLNENTPTDAVISVNDAGAIRYFSQRKVIDILGLNFAPAVFSKKLDLSEVTWIAIFPAAYPNLVPPEFQERQVFQIPPEDYTVCPCPQQSRMVVYSWGP